jgi:DNA-binding CsgD family transcriptional regulator
MWLLAYNTSEIAGMMHISYTTAETHRRNIRKKLSVDTSMELGAICPRLWVDVGFIL